MTGLIETMRMDKKGRIRLLAFHLQRLQHSARSMGIAFDLSLVLNALAPYVNRPYVTAQRVRICLSNDNIDIQCVPLAFTPQPAYLHLAPAPIVTNTDVLRYKTTQRQHWGNSEHWLSQHSTFFDVIHYDTQGLITEGSRSNIYVLHQNNWYTPPLKQNILNGVLRHELIQKGWVKEKEIDLALLHKASALRVSNALRGWLDAILLLEQTL